MHLGRTFLAAGLALFWPALGSAEPSGDGAPVERARRPRLALSHADLWAQTRRLPPQTAEDVPLLQTLSRVERLLGPLCAPRCGSVALRVDSELASAGRAEPGRHFTTVAINPTRVQSWGVAFGRFASFYVMAHEYGHHLDIFRQPRGALGNRWSMELAADVIAGCALQRSGAKVDVLRRAGVILTDANFSFDADHPPGAAIHRAVYGGFLQCARYPALRLEELLKRTEREWNVVPPGPRRDVASPTAPKQHPRPGWI